MKKSGKTNGVKIQAKDGILTLREKIRENERGIFDLLCFHELFSQNENNIFIVKKMTKASKNASKMSKIAKHMKRKK